MTILALVFLDEILAAVAAGVWGGHAFGVVGAVLAPIVLIAIWGLLASPKAPYGGPLVRPLVKLVVFTAASAGLWAAGHPAWALALAAFSAVINALAQLPVVRRALDAMASNSATRS